MADGLLGQGGSVVDIELSSTLGHAQQLPVGRTVAGGAEAGEFDEGLEQHGAVAVALLPVSGEGAGGHGEDARGEVVAACWFSRYFTGYFSDYLTARGGGFPGFAHR